MISRRALLAALLLIPAAPALAKRVRHHRAAGGSWDGRWAGAWGGRDATAINVSDGRVVSYEYGGQTNPVSSSHVTATRISYSTPDGVSVTMTRKGANTAHAKLHSGQGDGEAELVRK
jgi:hypothetical protein